VGFPYASSSRVGKKTLRRGGGTLGRNVQNSTRICNLVKSGALIASFLGARNTIGAGANHFTPPLRGLACECAGFSKRPH